MQVPVSNLDHLTKCPTCKRKFNLGRALILEEADERATLHLTCDFCKTSLLLFVVVNQTGVMSVGMVTDITEHEARELFNRDPIAPDQVLQIHEQLQQIEQIEAFI